MRSPSALHVDVGNLLASTATRVVVLAVPDRTGAAYGMSRHLQREADDLVLIGEGTIDVAAPVAARVILPAQRHGRYGATG